ncbi:hypothetical protein [Xanthomonas sacchari]|uniref:hypothetical protein n=1 Tax=Xanthomonas sacchari TaxID=56458 RepID=UPI00225E294B|nr:hypothetical protein [Xanthomonas sacchari]
MKNFEYVNGAVGPLKSGMTREEVRAALGMHGEFRKTVFSENTTDNFPSSAAHVFYDLSDIIKGVEIFNAASFVVLGSDILCMKASEAIAFFGANQLKVELMDSGFNIEKINASFHVPDMLEDELAKILSVYIDL